MRPIIEPPAEPGSPKPPLLARLGWFATLAAGAAAATALIAYGLKALLPV